jgi:hypothetical protein
MGKWYGADRKTDGRAMRYRQFKIDISDREGSRYHVPVQELYLL